MVAVIIVNYQSYSDTLACIQSLVRSGGQDYRIFVVDNSDDKSGALTFQQSLLAIVSHAKVEGLLPMTVYEAEHFTAVDVSIFASVINSANRGFAAANNLVLSAISAHPNFEFIWLLNNDTVVPKNALKNYLKSYVRLSQSKKLGLLGCLLVYQSQPDTIQGAGGLYNPFLGTSRHVLDGCAITEGLEASSLKIDYPIGASIWLPRAFLADVGLMNETYFLYFEELDWVMKGKKKGWQVGFTSDVVVEHKAGGAIGGKNTLRKKSSHLSDYYFYRNRIRFAAAHTPLHLPFVLCFVAAQVVFRTLQGRIGFLKLFWRKGF